MTRLVFYSAELFESRFEVTGEYEIDTAPICKLHRGIETVVHRRHISKHPRVEEVRFPFDSQ